MIRIAAGIAVCIVGVVVLSFAIYCGWVQDTPSVEPIARQLYRTFSMMFAVFSAILIGSGGFHVIRSIRRMNRKDRQLMEQLPGD